MRSVDNVITDMRVRFPGYQFEIETSGHMSFMTVRSSPGHFMTVELDIDYGQDSIVACVMNNFKFGNSNMALVLDTMFAVFG